MSSFPGSPHLIKGGIVLINPESSAIEKIITLQYNFDTLARTLQIETVCICRDIAFDFNGKFISI